MKKIILFSVLAIVIIVSGCVTDPVCGDGKCGRGERSSCPSDCDQTDPCENVVCEDSTLVCQDDSVASCDNTCSNGECSSCVPYCPPEDSETTESLMRSFFDDSVSLPKASVGLFDRKITSSLGKSSAAESIFRLEKERYGFAGEAGSLEFTSQSIADINENGYAFSVEGDRITVSARTSEGFANAMSEMVIAALQSDGKLPEGLFVNKEGPKFGYRSFWQPFLGTIHDINFFYEIGRVSSLLGYNNLAINMYLSSMDISANQDDYPGLKMFVLNKARPSADDVRSVFLRLKGDYPIEVHPVVMAGKASGDGGEILEEYLEKCGNEAGKRSTLDITRSDMAGNVASIVDFSHYVTAMDVPTLLGKSEEQVIVLNTDEPYTILGSSDARSNAGETYAKYINDIITESEKLLDGNFRFFGWHDAFYCDQTDTIRPSNGCSGWPNWLYSNYQEDSDCPKPGDEERSPLEEGRKYLDRSKFNPAVWMHNDYSPNQYESVLNVFENDGFNSPLCQFHGGTEKSTIMNALNFVRACDDGFGVMQSSFTHIKSHTHSIVLGSLVAKYGYRPWMETIQDDDLEKFRSSLGLGICEYYPC